MGFINITSEFINFNKKNLKCYCFNCGNSKKLYEISNKSLILQLKPITLNKICKPCCNTIQNNFKNTLNSCCKCKKKIMSPYYFYKDVIFF